MKIRDLVGRALVRLTGKPDTSVPPKIQQAANPQLARLIEELKGFNADIAAHKTALPPLSFPNHAAGPVEPAVFDDIGATILDQLKARGLIPPGMTPRVTVMQVDNGHDADLAEKIMQRESVRPGIKPPADGEMTWEFWQDFSRRERIEGWSPCRYANRGPGGTASFVFGVTRGHFGLYQSPYICCSHDDDAHGQHERILTALSHLPTGYGFGVFATQADAAHAAESIRNLRIDWTDIDIDHPHRPNGFITTMRTIQTAWGYAGMAPANFHAHVGDDDGQPLVVWTKDEAALTAGQPKSFGDLS